MPYGLLGTPGNLELRKRTGVSGLTVNNVDSRVSWETLTQALCVKRPTMMFSKQTIFREASEGTQEWISEETLSYCRALGLLEPKERNSSYFAWSNSMTSD